MIKIKIKINFITPQLNTPLLEKKKEEEKKNEALVFLSDTQQIHVAVL